MANQVINAVLYRMGQHATEDARFGLATVDGHVPAVVVWRGNVYNFVSVADDPNQVDAMLYRYRRVEHVAWVRAAAVPGTSDLDDH